MCGENLARIRANRPGLDPSSTSLDTSKEGGNLFRESLADDDEVCPEFPSQRRSQFRLLDSARQLGLI
ncbi:hypothetical protein D3C87_2025680 [compost metagenome]